LPVNHDFSGALVLTQTLKGSLAQNAVRSPGREFNLGDKARLDPMHPFTRDAFRQGDQGFGPHKIVKPLAQLHELRRVEPGPNAASIVQCSLWIIIAEKQRPEACPPVLGIGEAEDDKLFAIAAFDFAPAAAASGVVWVGATFRDYSFEPIAACLAKAGP
jgi:hypothetical protein